MIPDEQPPQLRQRHSTCLPEQSGCMYIERGELSGKLEEGTDKRIWLVSIDSLNTLRARRGSGGNVPESTPAIADTVPDAMRDLALRLESRAAEAAELRTRQCRSINQGPFAEFSCPPLAPLPYNRSSTNEEEKVGIYTPAFFFVPLLGVSEKPSKRKPVSEKPQQRKFRYPF
jgi:hypothetical protein